MIPKKYYVVIKGRQTGIFTTWAECEKQVKGFAGALYKSFKTKQEAEAMLQLTPAEFKDTQYHNRNQKNKYSSSENLGTIRQDLTNQIIQNSICVDAACSGNPGDVEYQGVDTATGKLLFHHKPMAYGTNNLGEFLAIVHGLAYLQKQGKDIPIYSDSKTAILWVKNKQVRTKLVQNSKNIEIFETVDKALNWLQKNQYSNKVLKWNTESWGEIPADFGRK